MRKRKRLAPQLDETLPEAESFHSLPVGGTQSRFWQT
jgi:hypothetical protein